MPKNPSTTDSENASAKPMILNFYSIDDPQIKNLFFRDTLE